MSKSTPDYWAALPYKQRVILTYAPKPCSLASLIVCTMVAIRIFRNKEKMAKMYHRLAFGMCFASAINSFFFFTASWSVPSDTPGGIHSFGTKNTCTFTGFMHQLGFVVHYYYVSLAVYVFFALRSEFRLNEIQWLEKYIHIGVFVIPLATAVYLAAIDMFNSVGFGCYITAPANCNTAGECKAEIPIQMNNNLVMSFCVLPIASNLCIATIIMIACLVNEQRKCRNTLNSKSFSGKKEIFERARRRKSKLIVRQGMLYLGVFYFSYLLPCIVAICSNRDRPYNFYIYILALIFLPLDGLFFTMGYLQLLRKDNNSLPIETSRITTMKTVSPGNLEGIMSLPTSNMETDDSPKIRRGSSVSLFDGTDEERWEVFGVYVGSDTS